MKIENYEKAVQLQHEISQLLALDDVLIKASMAGRMLAAINMEDIVITEATLTEEILQDFRAIIATEVLKRDKAFENL